MIAPINVELNENDRLTFYVGKVVLGFHKIFGIFDMAGVLHEVDTSDKFDTRRRQWHTEMKISLKGDAKKLRAFELLNDKLVKAKNMRDALVHGGPSLQSWPTDQAVVCTMKNPKPYRQQSFKYYRRLAKYIGFPMPNKQIKLQSMQDAVQISYGLDEIIEVADNLNKLYFEVMSLNVKAARAVGRLSDPTQQ